ncbi:MAG: hypothetical protein RL161_1293 [Bacteroidota bacterium]
MHRLVLLIVFLSLFSSASAQYKLYSDGLEKYNQKDFIGAIELLSDFLTRPVRDKKFDVDAYYWRGLASFKVSEFDAAVEDLQSALQLKHANQGNIYWFIAKAQNSLQHYPQSIESYTNALNLFSTDDIKRAQILAERADAHRRAGNTAEARSDLQQSLKLQPGIETVQRQLRELDGKSAEPILVEKKVTEPSSAKPAPAEPVTTRASLAVEQQTATKQEVEPAPTQQSLSPAVITSAIAEEPSLEELYKTEKRIALVIGNSTYNPKIGTLRNPLNDATDFAETLRQLNFDVTLVTDATYGKIRVEMIKFREKLNQGKKDETVGLFYYAGHGLQHDNENYIVPIDAELEFEDDIPRYCFPIQKMVLSQLEQTNSRMNIIVLDACRNNPFPAINRGIGENQGLGEMKKARGAFIAYATSPGSVASDGSGRNGLYTQELMKAMQRPGRTIEQVFKEVRANVLKISGDRQNPWENSNIIGDFYFKFN